MARTVLLDSGFLIALVNANDPDHSRCGDVWASLRGNVLTVEGVLVEAAHLLRRVPGGPDAAIGIVVTAGVESVPCDAPRLGRAAALMRRYHDVPMDLVDALLLAVAETSGINEILTLDLRGFLTYRLGRRGAFRVLPAPCS